MILSKIPLDENALRAAIDATGYTAGEMSTAPYEKNGRFSFFEKVSAGVSAYISRMALILAFEFLDYAF